MLHPADFLPARFPALVEMFEVGGAPVSIGHVPGVGFACAVWDVYPPRAFDAELTRSHGRPITEDEFRALVKNVQ